MSSFPLRIVNDNSTSICVTQAKENYRKIAECLNVYFHNSLDCIFYVSFPKYFPFFEMKAMEVHYTSLIILMEWIPPNHHAFYLDCLSYIYIFTVLIYIIVSLKFYILMRCSLKCKISVLTIFILYLYLT